MERYYFERQKELVIFDHDIVRNFEICKKLTSKEVYLILVEANTGKLTTQDYFKNLFETSQFNWTKIFLIWNTILHIKAPIFQCKVLHNILYANKMFYKFGKLTSS